MPTAGERVVATALSQVGVTESPPGSNSGPAVQKYQAPWHMGTGWPWCGAFAAWSYVQAGVDDSGLLSPSTAATCQRADAMGGLAPAGLAPPGSVGIVCGIHVFLVVHDRGDGLLDTIEGNSNDSVRRGVRARSDWRVIVPPAIAADAAPTEPLMVDSFGFDDLSLRPRVFGPWAGAEPRDSQMAAYRRAHPDDWTRAVRLAAGRFAFEAGRPGTAGALWRFGGWPSQDVRVERMRAYGGGRPGAALRSWRKSVPVPAGAGEADTGGKTT